MPALSEPIKQGAKYITLQPFALVHGRNNALYLGSLLLLIGPKNLLQPQLGKHLLHLVNPRRVLLPVPLQQTLSLRVVCPRQGLNDEPSTLVVLDIRPVFARDGIVPKHVDIVVVYLEILAQGHGKFARLPQIFGRGEPSVLQGQCDGAGNAVRRLVLDNGPVLLHGEVCNVGLPGGSEIAQLTQLGVEAVVDEEVDHVGVRRVLAEEGLEEEEDDGLEYARVVDGHQADLRLPIPAGLAAPGCRVVHYVVKDQVVRAQHLYQPCENGELLRLFLAHFIFGKLLADVESGQSAMQLAGPDVCGKALRSAVVLVKKHEPFHYVRATLGALPG